MQGIVRRSAGTSYAAQRAGLLVLILLAHLALIASPLHAMTMNPDSRVAPEAVTEWGGQVSGMPMTALSCLSSSTNCLVVWTSPASGRLMHLLISPVLFGGVLPLFDEILSLGPVPQALGPPKPADAQALLQVFRL
jgi:hypothetical protein